MKNFIEPNYYTPILPLKYRDNSNKFYIKRDDLLPFSFGGNKARIAEEYFKDLIEKGYDTIISYGNSRSNLNRVIANMSKSLGIPCYIVSPLEYLEENTETNNSKMVKMMDANIIQCDKKNVSETIEEIINDCKRRNLNPYYINGNKYGKGNEKIAVRAYVKAYEEILKYEKKSDCHFDYIFHASGTGMTQSGLVCGKLRNEDNRSIIGISIARDLEIGKKSVINNIISYLGDDLLEKFNDDVKFIDKYVCGGYSKYNSEIDNIINRVLSLDGIPLDRTYTGKAFWGMTEYIKEKKINNAKILFIHTGGTPLFFDDLYLRK